MFVVVGIADDPNFATLCYSASREKCEALVVELREDHDEIRRAERTVWDWRQDNPGPVWTGRTEDESEEDYTKRVKAIRDANQALRDRAEKMLDGLLQPLYEKYATKYPWMKLSDLAEYGFSIIEVPSLD